MDHTTAKEYNTNPTLKQVVEPDTDLKNMLVEYVGEKLGPTDQNVTVDMLIEVMAHEFPEFVLALAEENFLRGYEQGLTDVEVGLKMKLSEEGTCTSEKKRSCKLCEK
tara:strand:+ start:2444 stop:2767 length:324 start_codon:yes stop_codon:yes gene_type:complete